VISGCGQGEQELVNTKLGKFVENFHWFWLYIMTFFNCIGYVVPWFVNKELKMVWKEKIVDTSICTRKYQQFSPWIQAQQDAKNITNVKMVVASLKMPYQNFSEETELDKKEIQSRIADLERTKLWMSWMQNISVKHTTVKYGALIPENMPEPLSIRCKLWISLMSNNKNLLEEPESVYV